MKRKIDFPAWNGVAAGQTATLDLPIGPRYATLRIAASNTAGAAVTSIIDELRVLVNGKVQRTMSADELNQINKLNGSQFGLVLAGTNLVAGNAGHEELLTIFFQEKWRKELIHQEFFNWGTGNLGSFQLEADLNSTNAGVALRSYGEVDQSIVTTNGKNVQQPLGLISKWYRNQLQVTGTSQKLKLPFVLPNPDSLQAIHIFDEDVSKVTLRIGSFVLLERTKQENDGILLDSGMTPVSTRFDVVFDDDDIPDSALPMSQFNGLDVTDLTIQLDLSDGTPRNIPVTFEVVGRPD